MAGVLIGRSASGVGVDVGRRCLSRSLLQHQIVVVMRAWSQIVVLLIAAAALTSMSLLSSINIVASSSTASTLHAHPLSAPPGPSQSVPPPPPPKLTADPLSSSHSPCAPALSAELTHAAARNNDLGMAVATFANQAQADFAENWLEHLGRVGLRSSALVGATDDASAARLAIASRGAHCFHVPSLIGSDEAKWGSPGFAQMGRTKALLLRTLLSYNVTVLFADVDVAFLRDPRPFVHAALAAGADVLFHTDGFGSSSEALASSGLEAPAFGWGPELNTGLFLATPACLRLAERWCAALKSDDAFANWKNDQQALNELMRIGVRIGAARGASSDAVDSIAGMEDATAVRAHAVHDASALAASMRSRLIRAFEGTLRLGLLPNHLFPSGHVFFIQRALHKQQPQQPQQPRQPQQPQQPQQPRPLNGRGSVDRSAGVPIAVHLTFQNCDQSGKRHRMREGGLWLLDRPQSHYAPKEGLLSYEPDIPPELLRKFGESKLAPRNLRISDPIVTSHFELINHQLLQLRTALKLALLLNRTLVLPRFVCGLETVTNFPHRGIRCLSSNGCRMALPYFCPADHVLRMHYWRGVMREARAENSLPRVVGARQPETVGSVAAAHHHSPNRVLRVSVDGAMPARRCDERCGERGYVREDGGVAVEGGGEVEEVSAAQEESAVIRARLAVLP